MTSDKLIISNLVETLYQKGLKHIILTPGSRNAPLIIAFDNHPGIKTLSIVDERSAAFFALGMAQKNRLPIALACTSGTAALNYAPAIAEAYYQGIPLLILTADRPPEWIDQGEGQAMNQVNIYQNYIKFSCNLPVEAYTQNEEWYSNRLINEAYNKALAEKQGPVHINIPLREPIYNQKNYQNKNHPIIEEIVPQANLSENKLQEIIIKIKSFKKIMLVCGLLEPNKALKNKLKELAGKGLIVLTETTSNLASENFVNTIDSHITPLSGKKAHEMAPDLLITIGHSIVSKRIKSFLRQNKPAEHWQISTYDKFQDTFMSLTKFIRISPTQFFSELNKNLTELNTKDYYDKWLNYKSSIRLAHNQFIKNIAWSDFIAHQFIYKNIADNTHIQLANSTIVRYSQLFSQKADVIFHSNRGVSGIDGSSSTATGYAYLNHNITILISGDISFYYDINAFWNNYLNPNLKIIVINNQGGDIFRYIQGPDTTEQLETFFATQQKRSAKDIAQLFNLSYLVANNLEELKAKWHEFLKPAKKPIVLEIFTPHENNALTLRNYFIHLKKQIENEQ